MTPLKIEVTEAMVTAAMDAQPYIHQNSAARVWQAFKDDTHVGDVLSAALTAAFQNPEFRGQFLAQLLACVPINLHSDPTALYAHDNACNGFRANLAGLLGEEA
jgi:hypothetical protein